MKPAIFVGSSGESLEFARAIRRQLSDVAELTLWKEEFDVPGETFIETLVDALPRFDFAVLVLTPDDLTLSRGVESFSPRDNVIFEAGLFMGQLGRARTFLLYQAGADTKLPTDLTGLTILKYEWPRQDRSEMSSVGSACDRIRQMIKAHGPSGQKIAKELSEIRDQQEEQRMQIAALSFVVTTYIPWPELGHVWGLRLDKPFPFTKTSKFESELRRLRGLGVIEAKTGVGVSGLPLSGDLRDYFHITDAGMRYLEYREHFEGLRKKNGET